MIAELRILPIAANDSNLKRFVKSVEKSNFEFCLITFLKNNKFATINNSGLPLVYLFIFHHGKQTSHQL